VDTTIEIVTELGASGRVLKIGSGGGRDPLVRAAVQNGAVTLFEKGQH